MSTIFNKIKSIFNISKSELITYWVILLWIIFGVIGIYTSFDLIQLSTYYASLTLFVSTYLYGEYKRPSLESSIFSKGKNSPREIIIYITILLWISVGCYGIYKKSDLNVLTVYFSSLSPFIGSFILGRTMKKDGEQ